MSNLLIVIIFCFIFVIVRFLLLIYKKPYNRSQKKSFEPLITPIKEQEYNPDINTNNWHLHKNRLTKFGRSQYKGLTFFVNSENRIYYLSEDGKKFYC